MTPDWSPLDLELARWRAAGLCLPLWWRDDDAVVPSPALDRLTALARALEIPVHLAVIPHGAARELADYVRATTHLIPVVHGWAHRNHAPGGDKRAEFSANRPLADMRGEAAQGLARLSDLFADRLAPIFVPPWNRIAPQFATELAGLGYRALSTFTPRQSPFAAPGLARINTHLDPINWKAGRGLAPSETLITQVTRQLADRRTGRADNAEPYGILTHHLAHDDAIWAFTDALISRLMSGPCRLWATTELTQKDTKP
jgi:hypothetical protein